MSASIGLRSQNGTAATVVCGVAATDGEAVLDAARWLAGKYNAHLVVVHAFDEPVGDAEQVMAMVRRHTAADRHVETRLVEGSPAVRLLEVAREEDAELLVVGARGRGAISGELLGSVSRTLTESATCPLVVVPPRALSFADGENGRIICGVDGSQHAIAAARVARAVAERLGYTVAVVHAPRTARSLKTYLGRSTTPSPSVQPDSARKRAVEIVDEAASALGDRLASTHIEVGNPAEVLEDVAKRENGRAIVIAARGVGGLHAAALGSVALSLVQSADVPLVIVSEAAEEFAAELSAGRAQTSAP